MEEDNITRKIIGCAFAVHNILGAGFIEKVYENSLAIELKKSGMNVQSQVSIPVFYENVEVGNYYADLIVNQEIILEIKAVDYLNKQHEIQLVNYLTGTGYNMGLLINFGSSVFIKRKYKNVTKNS